MKRRDFLTTSCVAGIAAATMNIKTASAQSTEPEGGKKMIEWRTYSCKTEEKKEQLISILGKALVPALGRQKIGPVGIFEATQELNADDPSYNVANDLRVFTLWQYNSCDQLLQMTAKLLDDRKFMTDAAPIFEAPMNEPVYDACESTLMLGFNTCPAIETPVTSKNRIFQIRFYNSYNIERNAKKIDMFDIGGELPLFKKCGMFPVFFGETLIGKMMPNLTYMLGFENMEENKANWKKFVESPEWKAISGDSQYKNTANKIVNILLKPTAGSQL